MLAAGLVKAIENEMELISKTGEIQASLEVKGAAALISPQRELLLFRTVQEALNNCLRHSECQQLHILVIFDEPFIELTVRDNGKGFIVEEPRYGTGIRTMKNRMKLLGGELQILSQQGGTSVTMKVPLTAS
jgi:signal transduction histidine kinase